MKVEESSRSPKEETIRIEVMVEFSNFNSKMMRSSYQSSIWLKIHKVDATKRTLSIKIFIGKTRMIKVRVAISIQETFDFQ